LNLQMSDSTKDESDGPAGHPDEQPGGTDESPRFGRLLVVLALAVILVGILTLASEAYFSG
jgi:hypothetical protein